jgi:osmotically inducible protein OsmC
MLSTMKRSASALWLGDLRTGDGTLMSHSGLLDHTPYTWANRFENSPGTNPEEMLAGAHAACYTMAVCAALNRAGFRSSRLSTQAVVSFEEVEGIWTITRSHLELRAVVPTVSAEQFAAIANEAKANCPVSRVLRAEITLDAQIDGRR